VFSFLQGPATTVFWTPHMGTIFKACQSFLCVAWFHVEISFSTRSLLFRHLPCCFHVDVTWAMFSFFLMLHFVVSEQMGQSTQGLKGQSALPSFLKVFEMARPVFPGLSFQTEIHWHQHNPKHQLTEKQREDATARTASIAVSQNWMNHIFHLSACQFEQCKTKNILSAHNERGATRQKFTHIF